jgi:flagellin-specific chaperone FliS
MKLSNEQIEEFRQICEAELGLHMDMDEARAEATNLMQLYELFARPLPSEVAAHEKAHKEARCRAISCMR